MNSEYKFTYDEILNIKGAEPLINCDNINNFTENNYVSTYFNNLYKPFINKEIIEELDKIFQYSNEVTTIKKYMNTINFDSWIKYKLTNHISIKNMNETIIQNSNKVKYKPLSETDVSNVIDKDNVLYIHKEFYYKDNMEFLYSLLNCLFSSNNTYYIKKCERCKRYFLATIPNKKMCNRIRTFCGELTMCCNASKTFYKSKEYKKIFRMVENHLKHYYENNNKYSNYINNIREEFRNIKEKAILEYKYDYINDAIKETEQLINEDISKYL